MKYKKTKREIVEDNELFKTMTTYRMSKITGINQSYLCRVKHEVIIPSEKWYLMLRSKLILDR